MWDEDVILPEARQDLFVQIVRLTDAFCADYLDDEYAEMCQFMTADLCELQPSPLDKGRVATWAAGIIFTVGSINFLSDSEFDPYVSTTDLARLLRVSEATLYAKRKQIEKALGVMPFNPNYTVMSMMEVNPLAWIVEMDGFPMDIRQAPRNMQIEAFEQGLIPYLPGAYDTDLENDDSVSPPSKDPDDVKIIKFPGLIQTSTPDSPPTKKKNSHSTSGDK